MGGNSGEKLIESKSERHCHPKSVRHIHTQDGTGFFDLFLSFLTNLLWPVRFVVGLFFSSKGLAVQEATVKVRTNLSIMREEDVCVLAMGPLSDRCQEPEDRQKKRRIKNFPD